MNLHCTKCGITHASLHSQTYAQFDEDYPACPHCGTDAFLVEVSDDTDAYTSDYFTNQIRNIRTGEVLLVVRKTPPPPPVPAREVHVGKWVFTPQEAMQAEYFYQQTINNHV